MIGILLKVPFPQPLTWKVGWKEKENKLFSPHSASQPPGTRLQQTRLDWRLVLSFWGAGTPCAWWAGAFQPILPRPGRFFLIFPVRLEGEDFSAAWSVVGKSAVLCISEYLQLAVLRFPLLWGGAGSSGPLVPLQSSHIVCVAALCRMYFNPNLCFLGQVMFLPHPLWCHASHLYGHLTVSAHHPTWHSTEQTCWPWYLILNLGCGKHDQWQYFE